MIYKKFLIWYGVSITIATLVLVIFHLIHLNPFVFIIIPFISPYTIFLAIFGFIAGLTVPNIIQPELKYTIQKSGESYNLSESKKILTSQDVFWIGIISIPFLISTILTLIFLSTCNVWNFLLNFAICQIITSIFFLGPCVYGVDLKEGNQLPIILREKQNNIRKLESLIEEYPNVPVFKEYYNNGEYELGLKRFDNLVSLRDLNFFYKKLSEKMKISENFILRYNEVDFNSVDNLLQELDAMNQNSCPDLDINFSEKELSPDKWNKVNLIISNNGNSFAYGIKIGFSDGLKISGLPEDISIKIDPVSIAVSLKPIGSGTIAIHYSISATYEKVSFNSNEKRIEINFHENDYIKKGIFWLEIPEDETSKEKIHISSSNVILNNNVNITDSVINRSNINSRELFSNTTEGSEDITIEGSIVNRSIIGDRNEN